MTERPGFWLSGLGYELRHWGLLHRSALGDLDGGGATGHDVDRLSEGQGAVGDGDHRRTGEAGGTEGIGYQYHATPGLAGTAADKTA